METECLYQKGDDSRGILSMPKGGLKFCVFGGDQPPGATYSKVDSEYGDACIKLSSDITTRDALWR